MLLDPPSFVRSNSRRPFCRNCWPLRTGISPFDVPGSWGMTFFLLLLFLSSSLPSLSCIRSSCRRPEVLLTCMFLSNQSQYPRAYRRGQFHPRRGHTASLLPALMILGNNVNATTLCSLTLHVLCAPGPHEDAEMAFMNTVVCQPIVLSFFLHCFGPCVEGGHCGKVAGACGCVRPRPIPNHHSLTRRTGGEGGEEWRIGEFLGLGEGKGERADDGIDSRQRSGWRDAQVEALPHP
jgi:hypothetical protein